MVMGRGPEFQPDTTGITGQQDHGAGEKQFGIITDLIAAGEINGLVGGLSGVYLNGTALTDTATYAAVRAKKGTVSANGVNVTNAAGLFSGVDLSRGDRFLLIRGAGKSTTLASSISPGDTIVTVNTSNFFTDDMGFNAAGTMLADYQEEAQTQIIIPNAGPDGKTYRGVMISRRGGTEAYIQPPVSKGVSSNEVLRVDKTYKISSITNANTAVLTTAVLTNVTDAATSMSSAVNFYNTSNQGLNYDNAWAQLKRGTRYQTPINKAYGASVPSASYMIAPGTSLTWYSGTGGITVGGSASATNISSAAFNFGQNTKQEIDTVTITIEFPAGLQYISPKGNQGKAGVELQMILHYKYSSNQTAYDKKLIIGRDYGGSDFIDGLHLSLIHI